MSNRLKLIVAGALTINIATSALASSSSDYKAGIVAYKAHNYPVAIEYFKDAIAGGDKTSDTLLYLGHSYMHKDEKAEAISSYKKLVATFPRSAEARLAEQCLIKINAKPAVKFEEDAKQEAKKEIDTKPVVRNNENSTEKSQVKSLDKSSGNSAGKKSTGGNLNKTGMIEHVIVFPPAAGHPAVSQTTIDTVHRVLAHLPKSIYRLLDDAGTTITIAPNIEDKWPGSGDTLKPNEDNVTLGEEGGRTYGRAVHIYERPKLRGKNVLGPARTAGTLSEALIYLLGHAVDDVDHLSTAPLFQEALSQDLKHMPASIKKSNPYYTEPMEACSLIIQQLITGDDDIVVHNLPRSKAFIKGKLGL